MAALPGARFCLASATLTDNAVKDITSNPTQNLVTQHMLLFVEGSLGLSRRNVIILFKKPVRPEIHLQVSLGHQ